ncbi:MAG: VanZ family protein [Clostridia bacterium]|nr:VanZ family protein [Clostridia bacterium]
MKFTGSKIYRIFSILAVISVMGVIFFLSAQNGEESAETSSWVIDFLSLFFKGDLAQDIIRTFAHFSEYGVLGFLMYNVIYSFKIKLAPLISTALSLLYAISDEIHQYFVPERACQPSDLAVDFCGILLGTALIVLLFRLINKISLKKKKEKHYD